MRRLRDGCSEPAEGGTERSRGGGKNQFSTERTCVRSPAAGKYPSGSRAGAGGGAAGTASSSARTGGTADSSAGRTNRGSAGAAGCCSAVCSSAAGECLSTASTSRGSADTLSRVRSFGRSPRSGTAIDAAGSASRVVQSNPSDTRHSGSASAAAGRRHISDTSECGRHPAATALSSSRRIFFADTSIAVISGAPFSARN